MSKFQDSDYLKTQQYAHSGNLAARIRLHEQFSTNQESIQRWQFDRLLKVAPAEALILEVGCGRGDLWRQNADRIPVGWKITLSDLSAGMLEDCQRHLGDNLSKHFAFEVINVEDIPYPDQTFDIVIANYMLYHVPDLPKALSEIRRVLKPDGMLFAMTNGENHLVDLEQLVDRFNDKAGSGFGLMGVRFAFTLQNGADHLSPYFNNIQCEDFESALHVTQLQPLLNYIASSMDSLEVMDQPNAKALIAELRHRLDTDGAIDIRKETGLFTARNT
jgi:ubiquinone/menaquinone biosynthesis C-methylase UbiE